MQTEVSESREVALLLLEKRQIDRVVKSLSSGVQQKQTFVQILAHWLFDLAQLYSSPSSVSIRFSPSRML